MIFRYKVGDDEWTLLEDSKAVVDGMEVDLLIERYKKTIVIDG